MIDFNYECEGSTNPARDRSIEMASNGNGNGSVATGKGSGGRNGLPKIQTQKRQNAICHDDTAPTVKAQTIDELHSLQRKKSAPTTPLDGVQGAFANLTEEERHKQQLQSIRYIDHRHVFATYILFDKLINNYLNNQNWILLIVLEWTPVIGWW